MTKKKPIGEFTQWNVIAIWEDSVPKKLFKALKADMERGVDSDVYRLMWSDMLFYRGEDGLCINDECLEIGEKWLDEVAEQHGFAQGSPCWFWIKRQS
jgi:hypothetical protein